MLGGNVDRQEAIGLREVGVGAGSQQFLDHPGVARGVCGVERRDLLGLSARLFTSRVRGRRISKISGRLKNAARPSALKPSGDGRSHQLLPSAVRTPSTSPRMMDS
jgi:hypothetical protein